MITSSSFKTENYSERIKYFLRGELINNSELEWEHFLRDHREWIILRGYCDYTEVLESELRRFQYRIRDYLVYKKLFASDELVFRIINRFASDMDFNEHVQAVWLPVHDRVNELYRSYRTAKNRYEKL